MEYVEDSRKRTNFKALKLTCHGLDFLCYNLIMSVIEFVTNLNGMRVLEHKNGKNMTNAESTYSMTMTQKHRI